MIVFVIDSGHTNILEEMFVNCSSIRLVSSGGSGCNAEDPRLSQKYFNSANISFPQSSNSQKISFQLAMCLVPTSRSLSIVNLVKFRCIPRVKSEQQGDELDRILRPAEFQRLHEQAESGNPIVGFHAVA